MTLAALFPRGGIPDFGAITPFMLRLRPELGFDLLLRRWPGGSFLLTSDFDISTEFLRVEVLILEFLEFLEFLELREAREFLEFFDPLELFDLDESRDS